LVASAPLVLGAVIGARTKPHPRLLAGLLALAAGALLTALAFELFADSVERGGVWMASGGLLAGALIFVLIDTWLDRRVESAEGAATGFALLAAVTLDGVPENVALGVTIGGGAAGLALLAAIFVSNFPEALAGAVSMREQGRSARSVVLLWTSAAALLTGAVLLGAGPLAASSPQSLSLPLAFAAGAVLASVADTLMPTAYRDGGPLVALSTAVGFVLAFVLSTM
jgi:ZIP family zinc transporter